jgi:hypothetical protein
MTDEMDDYYDDCAKANGVKLGKSVTVDSQDLRALLFSTGTIKAIEQAVRQHQQDPLVAMAEPHLKGAHDRLNTALLRVERGETVRGYNNPLTGREIAALKMLPDSLPAIYVAIHNTDEDRLWRSLADRGYVQFGTVCTGIAWAGEDSVAWRSTTMRYLRLTPRGASAVSGVAFEAVPYPKQLTHEV